MVKGLSGYNCLQLCQGSLVLQRIKEILFVTKITMYFNISKHRSHLMQNNIQKSLLFPSKKCIGQLFAVSQALIAYVYETVFGSTVLLAEGLDVAPR